MDDPILMDVLYSGQYLLHKVDGLLLIEAFALYDIVEKLAALSILHDEVNIGFCLDNLDG